VVNDLNGFIANFWRATKHQPAAVAQHADYPVSHIDLGARHRWLMGERQRIGEALQDPDWPGDPKSAGWWLWGQCCWIGSGWCDWSGRIPHTSDAGMGIHAVGKIPHTSNADMGTLLTYAGIKAWEWLHRIAARLERVRVTHGSWDRCLNHHYGKDDTAVFLDPPYKDYEALYGAGGASIASGVCDWARENANLRIALCGHVGDYELAGWDVVRWERSGNTYGGSGTKDQETIWFSPSCLRDDPAQRALFTEGA
jgi:hypothetical protein